MPNTSDPQPLDLSMTEAIRKDGAFTTYLELAGSDGALGTRRAVKVTGAPRRPSLSGDPDALGRRAALAAAAR